MTLQRGEIESSYLIDGHRVSGVDEVGRGCLAGPVVAGSVVLDYNKLAQLTPSLKDLIRDSKKLSLKQRHKIEPVIKDIAIATAIGTASVEEIDSLGILNATFLAMRRSIDSIKMFTDFVLVDGHLKIKELDLPQRAIIKGDSSCFTIAAASILAKVFRDNLMEQMANAFPNYGFERHVGYGTSAHLTAIKSNGICSLHRKSFEPIRSLLA
jgi:ribonuclease HII